MSRGVGGVGRRAMDVLYLIGETALLQATLRRDLNCSTAALARLLASLARRQLIARTERPKAVRLTTAGRRDVEAFHRERLRPRREARLPLSD